MEISKKDKNIKFITTANDVDFIYPKIDDVNIRFAKAPFILPIISIIVGIVLQFKGIFKCPRLILDGI